MVYQTARPLGQSAAPRWRLSTTDAEFERSFVAMLGSKREASEDVDRVVSKIVSDVKLRGDGALRDYTSVLTVSTCAAPGSGSPKPKSMKR